jgi:pimeloyl-ACP methyl ester carboxylesterase
MAEAEPQFLRVRGRAADGAPDDTSGGVSERRIAYLAEPGEAGKTPGVMWLSGLKSEMTSTKASVLAEWARAHGHPCTRFDYSGHGQSPGRFDDGTVGAWLEEALAVFRQVTQGPQILVGSSMGGYIALLVLRALMREAPAEAARIKGLLLIAPAWDMTERLMWARFPENVRREIVENGVYLRPSKYGDGDYAISLRLIEEGRNHLIGDAPFDPGRPIHVVHGLLDPDVPWEHTLDLVAHLSGDHVRVSAVPDGEHRLSRPEDLDLMIRALEGLAGVSYAR